MWLYETHLKFELLMSKLWGQFTNTQRVHNVLESEELKAKQSKNFKEKRTRRASFSVSLSWQ